LSTSGSKQLRTIKIQLPELHSGQRTIEREARRFNAVACGRRFGKTTLGINLNVEPALRGLPVAWFSPTYKMLSEVWREARRILKPITTAVNAQEKRLDLLTGGVFDFWSLDNPDAPRGRKYARIVIDEAAMVGWLEEAWQASIRPTLTDYQGGAFLLSTPKGLNFFHQCFVRGQDANQTDWASWQMPTTANPFIEASEVEKARQELPEDVFNQEYLAQFIQNQGAVFRNIAACTKAPATTPNDHKKHELVAGVDWAQKADFTAISIFCITCKREVELDRFNRIDWSLQRARLRHQVDKWGVGVVLAESNSIGSPNLEALSNEGMNVRGFETTSASKPPLIQSLALALERVEAQWLGDPIGVAEFQAYESKVNAHTGRISYSAPEGGHDDTVIARALAWHCAIHLAAPVQHGEKLW
jgi:hypothetical protein